MFNIALTNQPLHLVKTQKLQLDKAVMAILTQSNIGDEKKGDLRGVYVYKFPMNNINHIIAYRFSTETLELIMFGPHENYYRDLKRFLNL